MSVRPVLEAPQVKQSVNKQGVFFGWTEGEMFLQNTAPLDAELLSRATKRGAELHQDLKRA